jgi:thioredoxin 1
MDDKSVRSRRAAKHRRVAARAKPVELVERDPLVVVDVDVAAALGVVAVGVPVPLELPDPDRRREPLRARRVRELGDRDGRRDQLRERPGTERTVSDDRAEAVRARSAFVSARAGPGAARTAAASTVRIRPVREVTEESFGNNVLQVEGPVVVDFWAPWCGPCRAIAPILEQLEATTAGRVTFTKLNVDENPDVAARYGVLSIPTVMLFAGGEPRETVVGARPRAYFEKAFGAWLGTTP